MHRDRTSSAYSTLKPPFGGVTALIVASLGQLVIAGSPPLITDDPETPGYGGWEINVTSSYEHTRGGAVLEAPLFDINYGLTSDRDQLKLEIRLISNDPEADGYGRFPRSA